MTATTSQWAAALLPHTTSRPVADRLVALVAENDLPAITHPPACGLTLPPRGTKLGAARAELYARAVTDPADVARMQRDARVGVRRALAHNRHTTPEWCDATAQRAADDGDGELFDRLAPRLPLLRLAEFTLTRGVSSGWADQHLPGMVAAAPLETRLAVAATLPGQGNRLANVLLHQFAQAPRAELDAIAAATPALAGPLAVVVLTQRPLDETFARFVVGHAQALSDTVAAARRQNAARYPSGVVPTALPAEAVDLFVATGLPEMFAAAVNGAAEHLSAAQVDAVLAVESPALTLALATSPRLTLTADQATRLAGHVVTRAKVLVGHTGYGQYRRPVYDQDALAAALDRNHPWTVAAWRSMLRHGSWPLTERWLAGEAGSRPRLGEVTALLADPGRALDGVPREGLLTVASKVAALGHPWADELASAATPSAVAAHGRLSSRRCGVEIIAARIAAVAEADPDVWATVVALAPTWQGTTDDLVATAVAVAS